LSHLPRRARRATVGRPAPAHRDRAGAAEEPAAAAARRGHERARRRERARGAGGARARDARTHDARHRTPPRDRGRRRPDRRPRARPRRRRRHARRAGRARRLVRAAGRDTVRFPPGDPMRLVRYGKPGKEKPGLIDAEGKLRDLSAVVPDIGPEQLSPKGLARLAKLKPERLPAVRGKPRFGPPLTGTTKFVAIGLNYSDHAAETGSPVPKEPIVFHK